MIDGKRGGLVGYDSSESRAEKKRLLRPGSEGLIVVLVATHCCAIVKIYQAYTIPLATMC